MEAHFAECRALLLEHFEERDARFYLERLHGYVAEPGEVLARAGAATASLTLLVQGEAACIAEGPPVVELDRIARGDWFGELSFVAPSPAAATVRAVTRCVCAELRGTELDDLGRENTRAASVLLHLLCEQMSERIIDAGRRELRADGDGYRLCSPTQEPTPSLWRRLRDRFAGATP